MNGTVKQFKDTLEQMKTIYNFDDEKTYIQTRNLESNYRDTVSIVTCDENTGITIEMTKNVTK